MSHFRIQFIVCMVVALALWTVGFALAAIDLERGLVLYYPFEGSGANQITDVSGENNHGEFRGAV